MTPKQNLAECRRRLARAKVAARNAYDGAGLDEALNGITAAEKAVKEAQAVVNAA